VGNFVVSGCDIVYREYGFAVYHYLGKFNLFEESGNSSAFFFILCGGYIVIPIGTREGKIL
jgi:hypothetical protein